MPRERVFLAQTPQAFRADVLAAAIDAGRADAAATDEAALAEAAGFPVRIVAGEATNLKITTMTDLRSQRPSRAGPCTGRARGSEPATTCTGWWKAGR